MPHDHGHAHLDPGSGDRRVAIAIWANAAGSFPAAWR